MYYIICHKETIPSTLYLSNYTCYTIPHVHAPAAEQGGSSLGSCSSSSRVPPTQDAPSVRVEAKWCVVEVVVVVVCGGGGGYGVVCSVNQRERK